MKYLAEDIMRELHNLNDAELDMVSAGVLDNTATGGTATATGGAGGAGGAGGSGNSLNILTYNSGNGGAGGAGGAGGGAYADASARAFNVIRVRVF
jgi:hypothetical protein